MRLQEIFSKDLYEKLSKLEPQYYYGPVKDTLTYYNNLFKEINDLLTEYGIKFKAEMYHKKRTEDKIDLYKIVWVVVSSTKKGKITKKRMDDWITIRPVGQTVSKSENIDPELKSKTKQVELTTEEW